MRALYVDLDGTLLGPGASLLRGADDRFSLDSVRALQACDRAGAEVVIYSGRRQSSVFESARMIGSSSYIFEIGCGVVIDGKLEWLTDGLEPRDGASIFDQITATGAPAVLLERFAGRLEYHSPWHLGREVSHLFRGLVNTAEANELVAPLGLRLVDNGVVHEAVGEVPRIHAYHLIPAGASKARGVARHMRARGYAPGDCIAIGDSREDLEAANVVDTFWLVANAPRRDPGMAEEIAGRPGIRIAEGAYGAGVYEAVITTLAERR
ncbi:MAG TPA: HAD hydrolase family protein [Solirubrobacteraceae bacterium]|nr:HAD hydrolase family protein [Solirubrobacteraceae bacterium]